MPMAGCPVAGHGDFFGTHGAKEGAISDITMAASWVEKVRVESGRETFHDGEVTGLGLRVSFTGQTVWQVIYRVKGDTTRCR